MSPVDPPAVPNPEGDSGLPREIEELLRSLSGGRDLDPQLVEMLKGAGIDRIDPAMLSGAMQQMRTMFEQGPTDGSLSPDVVRDVARTALAQAGDPSVSSTESAYVADAVRVANLWLDSVTDLRADDVQGVAWSRSEWVEGTLEKWIDLVTPVAHGVSNAVSAAVTKQLGQLTEPGALPEGMIPPGMNPAAMLEQMADGMRRMQSQMFAMQVGQGLGALAADLLSGNEISLPLTAPRDVVLLPEAITQFADGLGVDLPQVRLYLAAREVARARLFADVPWLGTQLLAAVRDYARDISIDTDAIEESVRSIDPSNPEAMQEALQGKVFAPPATSATQAAALRRLEASIALIEGWVDVVTAHATGANLPQSEALSEAVRRRRATGGPAERTFGALVGLELRPRRLRDAANLFAALEAKGGPTLRDRAWEHPDLAPTAEDLDDPLGYVERLTNPTADAMDAALDELLRGDAQGPDAQSGKE